MYRGGAVTRLRDNIFRYDVEIYTVVWFLNYVSYSYNLTAKLTAKNDLHYITIGMFTLNDPEAESSLYLHARVSI